MTGQPVPATAKVEGNGAPAAAKPDVTVTPPATTAQPFDASKLSDDDFEKVFGDKRLFNHPRFKSLSEKAKKADELEKAQQEAEKAKLAEQGKYKELADQAALEATELKTKLINTTIDNKIIAEASKIGVVDVEAVKTLLNRKDIKVEDDGTVTGVAEAIKSLLAEKKYLAGKGQPNLGGGTNPGNDATTTGQRFKLSQLQDPAFYRANEAAIAQAMKLNLIENDLK